MLTELEKRLIERQLNMISDVDAVRWAVDALVDDAQFASDPAIVELASLPTAKPRQCESSLNLLRKAVSRASPQFDTSSLQAETHARVTFRALCAKLVAGEVRPYDLCKVVTPIEDLFDFPRWLGDFYNHCDWCEPQHTAADFPHLIDYAARYVAESDEELLT